MASNCKKDNLLLTVKRRFINRFKGGAELSGKVNLMNVEVTENITDQMQEVEIRLHLSSEACASVV